MRFRYKYGVIGCEAIPVAALQQPYPRQPKTVLRSLKVPYLSAFIRSQRLNTSLSVVFFLSVSAAPSLAQTPKADAAPAASATPAPSQTRGADKPKQGPGSGGGKRRGGGEGADAAADSKTETVYDFHLPGPDGKDVPLSQYKDKYILIVNLGRKSSYNDQLTALIKLSDTYKEKGLVVIGVPSNDFGAAEPGTQAEILKAYTDAKVNFPIMGVSKLTGDDELPFFTFLTTGKSAPAGGPVPWNYTKFIIDKKGNVVARLDSDVKPDSPEMLSTIDEILDGSYKPKKQGGKGGSGAPMDQAN
jgi:glutathione peroxidase